MNKLLAIAVLSCATGAAGAAAAEPSRPPATMTSTLTPAPSAATPAPVAENAPTTPAHDHDRVSAFFMSGLLAAGQLAVNFPSSAGDARSSGVGPCFVLAAGATVLPRLSVYGEVGVHQISNPTLEASGRSVETKDVKMTQVWFGPGVTYYLMPLNLFMGASVGVSSVTLHQDGSAVEGKTELGPAVALKVGKEWWIANRVGLGVSAQALWASMKDRDEAANVTSRGLSLGVSAT
jgi:hypothetical protein